MKCLSGKKSRRASCGAPADSVVRALIKKSSAHQAQAYIVGVIHIQRLSVAGRYLPCRVDTTVISGTRKNVSRFEAVVHAIVNALSSPP